MTNKTKKRARKRTPKVQYFTKNAVVAERAPSSRAFVHPAPASPSPRARITVTARLSTRRPRDGFRRGDAGRVPDAAPIAPAVPDGEPLIFKCGNDACANLTPKAQMKRCAKCKTRAYCSADCQRADWKLHKAECSRHVDAVLFAKAKADAKEKRKQEAAAKFP